MLHEEIAAGNTHHGNRRSGSDHPRFRSGRGRCDGRCLRLLQCFVRRAILFLSIVVQRLEHIRAGEARFVHRRRRRELMGLANQLQLAAEFFSGLIALVAILLESPRNNVDQLLR